MHIIQVRRFDGKRGERNYSEVKDCQGLEVRLMERLKIYRSCEHHHLLNLSIELETRQKEWGKMHG